MLDGTCSLVSKLRFQAIRHGCGTPTGCLWAGHWLDGTGVVHCWTCSIQVMLDQSTSILPPVNITAFIKFEGC